MKLRAKKLENGQFKFEGSDIWVKQRLKGLTVGDYTVEFKKGYKRSSSQNSYYWAVIVTMVYEALRDTGFDEIRNEDDAHSVLKEMFFKKVIHSDEKDNLIMQVSTTQYTTFEFEEKMDMIRRWALHYLGITIPLPNEQLTIDL